MLKKMLVQRARSVLLDKSGQQSTGMKSQKKEHGWNQGKLFCVKKVKDNLTEKHCNVARKMFLEGRWT